MYIFAIRMFGYVNQNFLLLKFRTMAKIIQINIQVIKITNFCLVVHKKHIIYKYALPLSSTGKDDSAGW